MMSIHRPIHVPGVECMMHRMSMSCMAARMVYLAESMLHGLV